MSYQDELNVIEKATANIQAFPSCGARRLGLYPVVDSSDWIKRLVDCGVTTLQLRIKQADKATLTQEIKCSIDYCHAAQVRLFINDHWQLAIEHQAYGIHLGQEDLLTTDLLAIKNAGLRLGVSSHSPAEIFHALSHQPSYLAFGPIYPANSKKMPYLPQGIEKLKFWLQQLSLPLVAIGGINDSNIETIAGLKNLSGIAMISAITESNNPELTVKRYMNLCCQQ